GSDAGVISGPHAQDRVADEANRIVGVSNTESRAAPAIPWNGGVARSLWACVYAGGEWSRSEPPGDGGTLRRPKPPPASTSRTAAALTLSTFGRPLTASGPVSPTVATPVCVVRRF